VRFTLLLLTLVLLASALGGWKWNGEKKVPSPAAYAVTFTA